VGLWGERALPAFLPPEGRQCQYPATLGWSKTPLNVLFHPSAPRARFPTRPAHPQIGPVHGLTCGSCAPRRQRPRPGAPTRLTVSPSSSLLRVPLPRELLVAILLGSVAPEDAMRLHVLERGPTTRRAPQRRPSKAALATACRPPLRASGVRLCVYVRLCRAPWRLPSMAANDAPQGLASTLGPRSSVDSLRGAAKPHASMHACICTEGGMPQGLEFTRTVRLL